MLVCRCLGTFKMNSKFINIFCCCSNRINIYFFHLIQKQYTNTTMHVNCWDWCGCGGVEAYYMQAGSVGHRKPYANAIFWIRPIPFTFRLFTYQMNVCLCFFFCNSSDSTERQIRCLLNNVLHKYIRIRHNQPRIDYTHDRSRPFYSISSFCLIFITKKRKPFILIAIIAQNRCC